MSRRFPTPDEQALVDELTKTYGFEATEVTFFDGETEPHLGFDAKAAMVNTLLDPQELSIKDLVSVSADTITKECVLVFQGGKVRSATGPVNKDELIDGRPASDTELNAIASSRALGNALRTAGIDLLRLHRDMTAGKLPPADEIPVAEGVFNRATALAEAHALGEEAGLIVRDPETGKRNKTGWHRQLRHRYERDHSNELTDDQLQDWIAFLRMLAAPQIRAVA